MAKVTDWGNFQEASDVVTPRLIWCSTGAEKTGKNYLGLSAPGPIAIQCFDVLGLQGTVEKFKAEGKDVRVCKYRFDINDTDAQTMAQDVLGQFQEDYKVALRNARTIQWDETELWRVFRYAKLGDKSATPSAYDAVNFEYAEMIHQIDDTNANFQLIQKVKEKWNSVEETDRNGKKVTRGKPSGQMAPTGFKEVKYIVQANISHSWNKEQGFVIDVVNCRQNMQLAGEQYENIDFQTLAMLVFPESSEGDWE